MEYPEAVKFVIDWLWDHKKYGSNERFTTGMPWSDEHKMDAARMVRDATQKTSVQGEIQKPTANIPQPAICPHWSHERLPFKDGVLELNMCNCEVKPDKQFNYTTALEKELIRIFALETDLFIRNNLGLVAKRLNAVIKEKQHCV